MKYIVCYDIADDKRRRKVANILEEYGDRVQESVFELKVDKKLFDRRITKLQNAIEKKSDGLAIYQLCGKCDTSREYHGISTQKSKIGEEEYFIV